MVRRYAQQQEVRESEIRAQKAKAEAEREGIFKKLALEEERRRAEQEYLENLRNELQFYETEELAKKRDMDNMMKRERTRQELLAAHEY